jgi:hypothetical protein
LLVVEKFHPVAAVAPPATPAVPVSHAVVVVVPSTKAMLFAADVRMSIEHT